MAVPVRQTSGQSDTEIEQVLITLLRNSSKPKSMSSLLGYLMKQPNRISDLAVREAIWRLIDQQTIFLDPDLNLSLKSPRRS